MTKPFNPLEIVARMKVHLKRNEKETCENQPVRDRILHQFEHFTVDEDAAELMVEGQPVPCPAQVFLLLVHFCRHVNRVLSKEQLFNAVWGFDHLVDDNTVMVHIRRIREKIEPDPGNPVYLLTIRGLGYKLVRGSDA